MGAEGAVNIIHRREINAVPVEEQDAVRAELVERYRSKFGTHTSRRGTGGWMT